MRIAAINLAVLLSALALAFALVPREVAPGPTVARRQTLVTPIVDATGYVLRQTDFRRIASASVIADELLLELSEPDRIVAFTGYNQRAGMNAHRYQGKGTVELITDVESILALKPDLVLVHGIADPRHVQRLREAGVPVFDFGSIEGLATLWDDIRVLGALLGEPSRGEALIARTRAELATITADLPDSGRKHAAYVTVVGNRIYGGTVGTSAHDILHHGGLVDVAAKEYRGSPNYSAEQLLSLDPPLIVTGTDIGERLCRFTGARNLSACQNSRQGIIEVHPGLLGSAALGIVDAAREVRNAVYGVPGPHLDPAATNR